MRDAQEMLTETFTASEHLTPDTTDVLAKVDAIAKTRRRNRWALRATGVSLVSAGVVVGGIGLPGLLDSHHVAPTRTAQLTAAAQPTSSSTTDSTFTTDQEMAAYFNAGYDYSNAVALGKLWQMSDINAIKAEAGEKLLQGETLPVTPDSTPAPPENAAVSTFFADGYGYNDAVKLAAIWNVSTYQAKVEGGQKLEEGATLPVKPTGDAPGTTSAVSVPASAKLAKLTARKTLILRKDGKLALPHATTVISRATLTDAEGPALTAYFDAGYDYNDAVLLGNDWNQTNTDQIKAEAGQKLLDGDTLPVPPSGSPAPPENKAVDTFFADGYTYNDAVHLGQIWNVSTYQAKVDGGQKLENGDTLPVQPGS